MERATDRLVRKVQQWLRREGPDGRDATWRTRTHRQLQDRVQRLRRLNRDYEAVRLSQDIDGLRVVSIPDRAARGASPRMV